MKKILITLFFVFMNSFLLNAQSLSSLWKQAQTAREKDLPQTENAALEKICTKAKSTKAYGDLLKAQLRLSANKTQISGDSATIELQRLENELQQVEQTDPVLSAVYHCVLGKLYQNQQRETNDYKERSAKHFAAAMQQPDLLAARTAKSYAPFVVEGTDSGIFNEDLLHVIGWESDDMATLHKFYSQAGNRRAACITALELAKQRYPNEPYSVKRSRLVQSLDSLIKVYGDLTVCGEVAIARYQQMANAVDVETEDKYNYINYALAHWGAWPRMNILRNAQSEMTRPGFDVSIGEELTQTDCQRKIFINNARNISSLRLDVWRVDVAGDTDLNPRKDEDYKKLIQTATAIPEATQSLRFYGHAPYKEVTDSMLLPALPKGVYLLEMTSDNKQIKASRSLMYVSDLYFVSERIPNNGIRMAVLDAKTGNPISGAHIRLKTNRGSNNPSIQNYTTNEKGEVETTFSGRVPDEVYVFTDDDAAFPERYLRGSQYRFYDNKRNMSVIQLFTDRRIYRPSQTVQVAALTYLNEQHHDISVESNKQVKITLHDANGKEVSTHNITTDEFGVGKTEFDLPTGLLTGQYSIRATSGNTSASTYFSVEEYKRPTFDIQFDEITTQYQAGDTLLVTGVAKSFADVPVQNAKVNYTVTRSQALWWYRLNDDGDAQLMQDTLTTDDEGRFTMRVPLIIKELPKVKRPRFYRFIAHAQVTDNAGESHEGEVAIPLSTHPTAFSCNLPNQALRDSLKSIKFDYLNNVGKPIDGNVTFWIDGKQSSCKANETIKLSPLSSALHHLKAVCGNDTIEQDFVVFSISDKKPATQTHDWFWQSASEFPRDGKPVYIQMGASDDNQHILYTLFSGKRVIESGVIDQSNAITTREFRYKEEYGDGLLFTCAWVRDGKLYSHSATIMKPLPDKRLDVKFTTFRNRLQPGQTEEWTLSIRRPEGKTQRSQLMATLYDMSLDKIRKHEWRFSPNIYHDLPSTRWSGAGSYGAALSGYQDLKMLPERALTVSHFDEECLYWNTETLVLYGNGRFFGGRPQVLYSKRAAVAKANVADIEEVSTEAAIETAAFAVDATANGADEVQSESAKTSSDQLRENLNETAFFYTNLATDADGNVKVKFTLPDCITSWRFIGFAHDKSMNYGFTEGVTVAKKELMVQPNMPRFIRRGDNATITSRIFNSSSKRQSGTAIMQLIDPATQQVVYSQKRAFAVDAQQTANVEFNYTPSDVSDILICRITAEGKNFSDGEQHYLPILPDKEWVTNTLSFTQNEAGTLNVDLKKLFPVNDKRNKLTIEYTNNPTWLMVQALPTVAQPNKNDAISLAAAFYANTISNNILHQSSDIKQTLELWKRESGKETSLMSSLQKNEELKELALAETPWVMEAERETEQKQMLIQFFDESIVTSRLNSCREKLSSLQRNDGSWSWWPGMPGSRYITNTVSEMLVRLNIMCGKQSQTTTMLNRGINFLGKALVKEMNEIKKRELKGEKNILPSESSITTLYIMALDGTKISGDVKEAHSFMLNRLLNVPSVYTIFGKARTAIIFAKNGHTAKANEFLQSVKEYSVYTEEMGRYFDTRKAGYHWFDYHIPTEVAAIEAIKMLQPDDKQTVQEMQRWLLQEKRTTCWDTPINSVNAVYAFLNGETNKLSQQGNPTTLRVDGAKLELPQATAGLGYVKTAISGTNVQTFTAEKQSTGTSWGSIYAQFMQNVAEISDASAGLSVTREVLGDKKSLHVGDKITIRLTIKADRVYDFVELIDKRAACLEPVNQLSGYRGGYYCAPHDNSTNYYFDQLRKGTHVIETSYYIDRKGSYTTGTCTVQCAYATGYAGRAAATSFEVK